MELSLEKVLGPVFMNGEDGGMFNVSAREKDNFCRNTRLNKSE